MNLEDYAEAKRCPVCQLPQADLEELERGYDRGIRYRPMVNWLQQERGTSISYEKMKQHFSARHRDKS